MFIVKVPGINSLNGETKGCERAGNAILDSLKKISHNEQGNPIEIKSLDLEEIHLDNKNLKLTNNLIYENALETFEIKPKTIFLGGDHSISYSLIKAFLDYCKNDGKEPCLIIFDSKIDCMAYEKEDFPTNRGWLKKLIEEGFPLKNILVIGIRNSLKEEFNFIKKNGIKLIQMNQIFENIQDTTEIIMEFAHRKELYLSLDIGVVDPCFVPSATNLEPGGLTSREFLYVLHRINKMKNLKAIDLVEINSERDKEKGEITVRFGAKIVSEFI